MGAGFLRPSCYLAVVALLCQLLVGCSSSAGRPSVTLPDDDGDITVTIKPTSTKPDEVGLDLLGPATVAVSDVYDVDVSREPAVALVSFPVPKSALSDKDGKSIDPDDLYVALYDQRLGWIPLPSHYDPDRRRVQAITPHLSGISLKRFVGGIEHLAGDVGTSIKDGAEYAGGKVVDGFRSLAGSAGGAISDFSRVEWNGVKIIGGWMEQGARGVADSLTGSLLPEQHSSGCANANAKASHTDLSSNVKYLEGCVLSNPPATISIANHGFLPFEIVGTSQLKPTLDLEGDSTLALLVAAVQAHMRGNAFIAGHGARRMTMGAKLRADPDWQARVQIDLPALVLDVALALLQAIPAARRLQEVILTLRVQIEKYISEDGLKSATEIFVILEKVVRDLPATAEKPELLENVESLDKLYACALAPAEAAAKEKPTGRKLMDIITSTARKCVLDLGEFATGASPQFAAQYLSGLVDTGAKTVQTFMAAYEFDQLTNVLDSRIEVRQPGTSSPTDDHETADVYFPQGVQCVCEPVKEPKDLALTGDSSQWISDVQWSSWTASSATGSGIDHVSCKAVCKPGQPQVTDHDASFTLDRPIIACGKPFYSRITETLDGAKPTGRTFLKLPVESQLTPTIKYCPEQPGGPNHLRLFETPSRNIICGVFLDTDGSVLPWGRTESIGCTIQHRNYGPAPSSCQIEPTYLDELGASGQTFVDPCSGTRTQRLYGSGIDSAAHNPVKVGYDVTVDLDAAKCRVTMANVRCVNAERHGFELAREHNHTF
jgi:hypothetical protein